MSRMLLSLRKANRLWRAMAVAVFVMALIMPPFSTAKASGEKIGLVTAGSAEDLGFNSMAYQGLQRAQTEQGIAATLYEPASADEYAAKLTQCVSDGNQLCFAVGFSMADAVAAAASTYPSTHFAILDFSPDSPPANLKGILFNEKQAGYLAGSLAGKMTGADVGAIGGMEIPAVVGFLDGYRNGAQCAKAGVDVLLRYTGTFTNPSLGAAVAEDMISRGVDVIFGAAGATGNGAILYSAQNEVWSIGVDADQYLSVFENGVVDGSDKLLTSAMKRLDNAVYDTIADELAGAFSSGTVTYGLANDGVGLAPYHETDSGDPPAVTQATKDYVDSVKAGILAGTIDINYPCRPCFHAEVVENDVQGYDWVPGWTVDLTIDDPGTPGVDFSASQPVNSFGTVVFSDLGSITLAPGMVVTMTHDDSIPQFNINKTLTVTTLMVTGVDTAADTVWGTGPVDANLNVQYCDGTGCSWRRFVTVQPDNTWLADFSVAGGGSSPEEQNILNIVPGMRGEALQGDEDNDITDYQWYVPNPTFSARLPENEVHGYEWPLGASVTINIDDPDNGLGVDHTDTQTVIAAPWDARQTWVKFVLGSFELQPGQLVTLSQGATTKQHTVSNVAITNANLAADTIAGSVEPSSEVHIEANCGPGGCAAFRREIADGSGNWSADFSTAGGDPDEQALADIQVGSHGEVRVSDAEGDFTARQWDATHNISGGVGVGGATVSYTGGSPIVAAANGSYSIPVALGWSGTVTPSKSGYVFLPGSLTYFSVVTDQNAQNYTAHATCERSLSLCCRTRWLGPGNRREQQCGWIHGPQCYELQTRR